MKLYFIHGYCEDIMLVDPIYSISRFKKLLKLHKSDDWEEEGVQSPVVCVTQCSDAKQDWSELAHK